MLKLKSHALPWLLRFSVIGMGLLVSTAHGGAIDVPMQSGKAAGMADAFTAQADDPSAIFYNPAGLTQLQGTNASGGVYLLQPEFNFDGDNGSNESMNLPSVLPHFYAESDLGTKRFRVGLGINNVFGINEDWGNTGPLRFDVNKAQLSVLSIAPTAAYQFTPKLSMGLAFNIYYSQLLLTRNVLLGAPPTPEGQFHLRGSATSFGVTPGILYKIDDRNTIGAYYRSPFSLNYQGNAQLRVPGVETIGPSPVYSQLDLPMSAGIGYMIRPIDRLKIETDLIWTDWHATDELPIHSSNPAFNKQTIPAHWMSGFTGRIGAQYQLSQSWAVRAGYAYGSNAVPGSTFSPIVPDSAYNLFAVGLGYHRPHWGVDVAYQFIYRLDRQIEGSVDSPSVNGRWSNTIHGLMLTLNVHP